MGPDIVLLTILLLLSAIFSGSETALVSLTSSKVDELVNQKKKNSKLLKKLKKNPHRLLITVLIGNNIVNIAASALAAVLMTEAFGSSGVGIATAVMTLLILVFGEITPKSFSHQHAVGVSLFMARPIYVMQVIFFPFVWTFERIVDFVNQIFGSSKSITVTEGELMAMVNIGAREGSIERQEKELIENVLEFNDIKVEEVMTPRVSIEALNDEMSIQDAVEYAISHSHSRLPVIHDNLDNIVGIVSIKELLDFSWNNNVSKKLKNLKLSIPLEVPKTKKINKLFRELQRKHQHFAMVIDEFGGTAGLVTLEDLLEEIVGDIVDESDKHINPLDIVDKTNVIVSGNTLIEDVNDFFKLKFGKNELDTVNGLLVDHLGRFPREGETLDFPRLRIQILEMDQNVVKRAQITKKKKKIVNK